MEALEEKLKTIDSVTAILDSGKSPEEMLEILLGDLDLEITDKMDVAFTCNCDKERVEKSLISLGRKEIKDMISEGKDIEIKCQICNKAYYFSPDDLKKIISKCI